MTPEGFVEWESTGPFNYKNLRRVESGDQCYLILPDEKKEEKETTEGPDMLIIEGPGKRFEAAKAVMQGMLANPTLEVLDRSPGQTDWQVIAESSCLLADALLTELEKQK